MAKAELEFSGFNEYISKLNKLEADVTQIATDALYAANDVVRDAAAVAIQKPNLPRQGRYSRKHGGSAESLRQEPIIDVKGTEVAAHVGFDLKKGGYPTLFLMYGTPKMAKVQALYDAFFGQEGAIMAAERKVYDEAIERIMR